MPAKWEEGKYGFSYLRLPGGFMVTIGWDSSQPKGTPIAETGYKVSFEDTSLSRRIKNLAEAKKAGERLARRLLSEALVAVPESE